MSSPNPPREPAVVRDGQLTEILRILPNRQMVEFSHVLVPVKYARKICQQFLKATEV